jgi:nicotinamide-nucleotide amidase
MLIQPSVLLLDVFLKNRSMKLIFAESMTAGSLCAEIMYAPQSGDYLLGSLVCFDAAMKTRLLDVSPALIQRFSAESKEVTQAMLEGLMQRYQTDVGVAITGLAYPSLDPRQQSPIGTVYYAFAYKDHRILHKMHFSGEAEEIVAQTGQALFRDLLQWLKSLPQEKR